MGVSPPIPPPCPCVGAVYVHGQIVRRGWARDHPGYARLYLVQGAHSLGQEPPHPRREDKVGESRKLLLYKSSVLLLCSRNKSFVVDLQAIDSGLSVDEIRNRMRPLEVPFKNIHV